MIHSFRISFLDPVSKYRILNSQTCSVWRYGLWSLQTGGLKLEIFLHKNQHTQRIFLNFENWTNGKLSSLQKSDNIFHSSIIFAAKIEISGSKIIMNGKNTHLYLCHCIFEPMHWFKNKRVEQKNWKKMNEFQKT